MLVRTDEQLQTLQNLVRYCQKSLTAGEHDRVLADPGGSGPWSRTGILGAGAITKGSLARAGGAPHGLVGGRGRVSARSRRGAHVEYESRGGGCRSGRIGEIGG